MFVCIVILVVTFILFIVHIPFGNQHLLKRSMWLNKVDHHHLCEREIFSFISHFTHNVFPVHEGVLFRSIFSPTDTNSLK